MKVLVGTFVTESNAHSPMNEVTDYDIAFGDDCLAKSGVSDVFDAHGIEMIPMVYASGAASGVIKRDTFDYLEGKFLEVARERLGEYDGIWLMLHGASYVDGLGSGDHHIVAELRKIVGRYMPICVACDPHGNLCEEYVEQTTVIRSYRESPHTDALETKKTVAEMLCDLLCDRQNIRPAYRKLPLILGGEQSVSTDEPVRTFNRFMDEMERDERILSASWHVGYLRHDTDVAGCGVVVVPATAADQEYAEQKVEELASFVWGRRGEFHFNGLALVPDEALKVALEHDVVPGHPVFITDSGDNTTSGAPGGNTVILAQALALGSDLTRRVLFANINDPAAYGVLSAREVGETCHISLGMGRDEWSQPIELDVEIKAKGELRMYMMHDHNAVPGQSVLVHVCGTSIDINVANYRTVMCEPHQYEAGNVDWRDYDVIVNKMGYAFPWLKEVGGLCIMSLTNGTTPQDVSLIPFKRIMRPMYPIDQI